MPHPTAEATTPSGSSLSQPILAGLVCGVVGFTGAFAIVLTGLQHVGATPRQAASGLLVLCVTMGLGSAFFSWRYRMPVTMAWSTPGAALLAGTTTPDGGFATAVGAFMISGALLALCGLVRPLARLVRAIPTALANAMLAGVLLTICLRPFVDLVSAPLAIGPVIVVWLVLLRFARRWAVPGSLVAAAAVMAVAGSFGRIGSGLQPVIEVVLPRFTDAGEVVTAISIGVPLFLVTMTSQNIAGLAVLGSYGYHPRLGPMLGYTGAASVAGAVGGGHAINLAAISAALAAGPEAGPDRDRRWIAGVTCGIVQAAFGPLAGAVTAIAHAAPAGLLTAIAGLALIATFAAAAAQALADRDHREAAALTFIVAATGIAPFGIGSAFWALVAGLVFLGLFRLGRTRRTEP